MFGQTVADGWVFEGEAQIESLSRVMYVAEQGQPFVLLQGGRGAGKSTLLSRIQSECQRGSFSTVRISAAALDTASFLTHLAGALSIVSSSAQSTTQLMGAIRDEINGRSVCDHRVVVLLDDIHLASESLEPMIRFLAGVNQQTSGGITVIATAESTVPPSLAALSELRVTLPTFTDSDATSLVAQKLTRSGVDLANVSEDAVAAMVGYGGGMPGRLCRACEIVAIAAETDPTLNIDRQMITELTRETLLADVA